MLEFAPYLYDKALYHMTPIEHRWIFNKLTLAEKLGHVCGPTGTKAPEGVYCIRPIYNMHGSGLGGFYKVEHSGRHCIPNRPGYFWTPWLDGTVEWVQWINDVPVYGSSYEFDGTHMTGDCFKAPPDYRTLPTCLRGFSRYLVTEYIGGVMIEASPRLLTQNARQEVIDFHRENYDPDYAPGDPIFGTSEMVRLDTGDGGWYWGESSRTPYEVDNQDEGVDN